MLTPRERQKITKMAETDKLNIDSIIQRLLEGKLVQTLQRYDHFVELLKCLDASKM